MNATELMTGNYVEYCGKYYQVVDILTFRNRQKFTLQRYEGGETFTIYGASDIKPIPLTDELLVRSIPNTVNYKDNITAYYMFGSKNQTGYYIRKDGDKFYLYIPLFGIGEIDIDSVHHLQNLLNVLKTNNEIKL